MKKKSSQSKKRSLGGPAKARPMYLHRSRHGAAKMIRRYDASFAPTKEYREQLPDMMEAVDATEGSKVAIQQVGVANFKLPLYFKSKSGKVQTLTAQVTGTVSLAAHLKGINMSRIMRTFYEHRQDPWSIDSLAEVLRSYKRSIGSLDARLKVETQYPIIQKSLRSGLEGYQYYAIAYEASIDTHDRIRRFIRFSYVYSSACPCSAELTEHARDVRGVYGIPHSQRSRAIITVEVTPQKRLFPEDLQMICLRALKTETQVMVKREDEQAFAEMNGAYIKFVEDAARLLHQELQRDKRILDFEAVCAHFESLHSHDAVSVICKGRPGGFTADFSDFQSLTV